MKFLIKIFAVLILLISPVYAITFDVLVLPTDLLSGKENYYNFMDEHKKKEIEQIAKKYNIDINLLNDIIGEYEYSGILDTGKIKEEINKPLIEKVNITKSIKEFIINLINKFK